MVPGSGQINKKQAHGWEYSNNELYTEVRSQCNTKTEGIQSVNTNPTDIDNNNSKINYFLPGPYQEADRRLSAKITEQLQKKFKMC